MSSPLTRRGFVKAGAAATLLFGVTRAGAQPAGPNSSSLRVRESALRLPPGHPTFAKYAAAVKAMHELPETDGRNWRRQARIHAEHCVHNELDFTAWHRHYLNQFEQICGQLIGDPNFALPYWDWSEGRGQVPDPFFDIPELNVEHWNDPGVFNPPNWPDIDTIAVRAIGKGVGVQDDPVRGGAFSSDSIHSILRAPTYNLFKAMLEGKPHNSGHLVVGLTSQGKAGHMASGLSPLDPIFWLHHCNVDRLWAQWQLAGNQTPDFDQEYNGHFVDRDGRSIDVMASDALDFEAMGYSYTAFDNPREFLARAGLPVSQDRSLPLLPRSPAGNSPVPKIEVLGKVRPDTPVVVGVPSTFRVPVKGLLDAMSQTRPVLDVTIPDNAWSAAAKGLKPKGAFETPNGLQIGGIQRSKMLEQFGRQIEIRNRIVCKMSGVKGDFTHSPIVNVFVNCPYLEPSTPYTDIHYADTFAFFGPGAHGGAHADHADGRTFVVDLTEAVERVNLTNIEDLKVQLMGVTAPGRGEAGQFSVDSIEILKA